MVGPTASGKSELAVKLAKKFNGEIISADSRQIYRGLNIGSGKVKGQWKKGIFYYKDIPHYLIDEANPKLQYSVAKFQKSAKNIISNIISRGKVPILCGGTGHWIDAVVFDQHLPQVKPNQKLRSSLDKFTTEQLFNKLKILDPKRAKIIDAKNPRRLLRALEIVMTTGQPITKLTTKSNYKTLWLGVRPEKTELEQKIKKRLDQRIKQGLLTEVKKLREEGLSWKRLESFGLEYKFCALFLQKKITQSEMKQLLLTAIKQYAKRQLTWWKRNQTIYWSDQPTELVTIAKRELS